MYIYICLNVLAISEYMFFHWNFYFSIYLNLSSILLQILKPFPNFKALPSKHSYFFLVKNDIFLFKISFNSTCIQIWLASCYAMQFYNVSAIQFWKTSCPDVDLSFT